MRAISFLKFGNNYLTLDYHYIQYSTGFCFATLISTVIVEATLQRQTLWVGLQGGGIPFPLKKFAFYQWWLATKWCYKILQLLM